MKEDILSQSITGHQDRLETGGRTMEELIAGSLSDLLAYSVYVLLDSLFLVGVGEREGEERPVFLFLMETIGEMLDDL